MTPSIDPNPEHFQTELANIPTGVSIVMLNLLKFRAQANYPDKDSELSGEQAYALYASQALEFVQQVGGNVLWSGSAKASLIAPDNEAWDKVLLVKYPGVEQFMAMLTNPQYQAITMHRSAALENSRLIATVEES